MTKNQKISVSVIAILVFLILIIPIPQGSYDDGGTRTYDALLYKIVVWNTFYTETNEDGSINDIKIYHNTSVYLFPNSLRDIDDLWNIEREKNLQLN